MEKINGAASVLLKAGEVAKMLQTTPTAGKKLLEPLKTFAKENDLPLNILEDYEVSNEPEAHRHEHDLWHCLQGEVIFVCGGELIEPRAKVNKDGSVDEREWKGRTIKGGREVSLKQGDWLFIPAGEPHSHRTNTTARLIIIKIPKVN